MRGRDCAGSLCYSLKDMERLVEGIREGLENAARADCLADRMECLMQTASMCKTLRTKCNRALMELQRIYIKTKPR